MNNKKKRMSISIFTIFFILSFGCKGYLTNIMEREIKKEGYLMEEEKLGLKIIMDKTIYKKGDSIRVSFLLTNRSLHNLVVNKRMFLNSKDSPKTMREIYLKVTHSSGDEIPFLSFMEVGYPIQSDFEILQSKKSILSANPIDLTRYYNFKEGTYEILAFYENSFGKKLNIDSWEGKIISEPLIIEITGSN